MSNGSWRVDETYVKVKGRWMPGFPEQPGGRVGRGVDFPLRGRLQVSVAFGDVLLSVAAARQASLGLRLCNHRESGA
jgi:hypothetical protein